MPTREELQEAYAAFRLPLGADWRTVKKRYKLLVKAWHPDKQGGQVKEEVEQELKEYNHFYNDVFKIHFDSEHLDDSSCICRPLQEAHKEPGSGSFDFQEDPSSQASQTNESFEFSESIDPEIEARSQRRRWQASGLCAVVFVLILGYGFVGSKIKSVLPQLKNENTNVIPSSSLPANSSDSPATISPNWHAPFQSISGPITKTQSQPTPVQNSVNADDVRRSIVAKECKMQLVQQSIDTLKAQIKIAQPASAGILYRELGSKEAEMRGLQQDVYSLRHSIGEN